MQRSWQLWIVIGFIMLGAARCQDRREPAAVEHINEEQLAESESAAVNATGRVVPMRWTVLSFPLLGTIAELTVEEGQAVEAGDVLARLDSADLEAALAQAEAEWVQAEANLAKVKAGPAEEEITAAELAVEAANARVAAAVAQRDALYSSITEADIAEAYSEYYAAYLGYEDALEQLQDVQNFDPDDCLEYEDVAGSIPTIPDWVFLLPPEVLDTIGMLLGISFESTDPADTEILLRQQVASSCPIAHFERIEDYYELAELGLKAAEAYYEQLLAGPAPEAIELENARVWLASTQVVVAQAHLDYLLAQPLPEDIAVAEAEAALARAEVQLAEARLEQAVLIAPFDGVITDVFLDASESVAPGQPVLQLGDLTHLRVETTDLNEIDVIQIAEGDTAKVTFDALPGIEVEGIVFSISPSFEEGTGKNYTVTIELDEIPSRLRWGMTALVDIEI